MIFLRRSSSFNISSRNPPRPAFPVAAGGPPADGAGGVAGRVANEGAFTAPGGPAGGAPGIGGIFGGGGSAIPPAGGVEGGPAFGGPEGGPDGGPAFGGPEGGPDGGPAFGGPEGGPAFGGPEGGPAFGGPDGGPAFGGPEGGAGFAGVEEGFTSIPEAAKLGTDSPLSAVSVGLLVESILKSKEAAFSLAAPLFAETATGAASTETDEVPVASLTSLTRFKSFLALNIDF
ncbi:hypothetical protein NEF87_000613 [Candidatus Lokiarchaeum ossiferum]|uniref:Collagen-like protein n=1 Tax=Candidatus Lokiarchaeum ossiferum TaxID=2951803 RepID=A0ABY6HM03_9ARCH|nr:hypothetical protein NEF87_000613 [Candidatus Lokiarchaeum sp. B-35]